MASAKKEAQKSLGSVENYINLSGLNRERELANERYNTDYNQYTNSYNDVLNQINANREKERLDFSRGRSTIAENAYMRNRSDLADLASRGLSGGVAQLSKLGDRIETGRQYSTLANTYYNNMNDLDASQKSNENTYNYYLDTARNNLNSVIADIDAREAAGRNAYNAAVAQLAEQIQARRDAAAQAAAALRQAKQQANNNLNLLLNQDLESYVEKIGGTSKIDSKAYNELIKMYKNRVGGTDADAKKWLEANNYKIASSGTSSSSNKSSMSNTTKAITGALGTAIAPVGLAAQASYYGNQLGNSIKTAYNNAKNIASTASTPTNYSDYLSSLYKNVNNILYK